MSEFPDGFPTYYEFEIDALINLDFPSMKTIRFTLFQGGRIFFKYESRMTRARLVSRVMGC